MSDDKDSRYWFRLNFETVAALAAIVTSVAAVYIAWQETRIMRMQQHASVLPILYANSGISGDEGTLSLRFSVTNAGVGPAKIKTVGLTHKGAPMENISELKAALLSDALKNQDIGFYTNSLERRVLMAGESQTALRVQWADTPENQREVGDLFTRITSSEDELPSLQICYCSVFNRCWMTDQETDPQPVDSCPAPTRFIETFFQEDTSQK